MGFNYDASTAPARIEVILTAVRGVWVCWSLTVKPFQRLLGPMAAASNGIPFGLLYIGLDIPENHRVVVGALLSCFCQGRGVMPGQVYSVGAFGLGQGSLVQNRFDQGPCTSSSS